MDPLSTFLTAPRARDAFTLRVMMTGPFAIDVRDESALTMIVPVRGTVWLMVAHEPVQRLQPGMAAAVRGPAPYRIADAVETPTTVVIGPDQTCRTPEGAHLDTVMRQGVKTWGNSLDGETTFLVGTYSSEAAVGRLVVNALPPVAVLEEAETDQALAGILERELATSGLGQGSIIDRLLDVMLLNVVRAVAGRDDRSAQSWMSGYRDALVSDALSLLHDDPAAPWTVAELARRVHVSRATFAARFRSTVGQPPMGYLATWRLALAADRLADTDVGTAAIAAEIGYGSAFTFGTAFTRRYGMSPTDYRRRAQSRDTRAVASSTP